MVLESICRGNFSPPDFMNPNDPEYRERNGEVCSLLKTLQSQLSEAQYRLVDKLVAKIYSAQSIECESYFKLGFSAGLELQREAAECLKCLE